MITRCQGFLFYVLYSLCQLGMHLQEVQFPKSRLTTEHVRTKKTWACNDHTFKLGDDSRCFLSLCRKELIVRTKKTKTNDLGNISLSEHSLWKTDRLRVYEIHIV